MTGASLSLMFGALVGVLPPGSVVLGVGAVDGLTTDIVVVTPSGEREVVGALAHARGFVPKGIVHGDEVWTTARVADDARAVLERTSLVDGARQVLVIDVLATQAPSFDANGAVLAVRQVREGSFTVLRAQSTGMFEVGRTNASWLTPVRGAPGAFLVVDGARTRVAIIGVRDAATMKPVGAALGAGRVRSPVLVGRDVLFERARPGGRAEIVVAGERERVVRQGLAGMDPLPCAQLVVFGTGEKRAAVVVGVLENGALVERARLDAGRAGVASPRACAVVEERPVVVAWVDRGASLPGELWRLSHDGSALLLPATVGVAVEVYGVIPSPSAERAR